MMRFVLCLLACPSLFAFNAVNADVKPKAVDVENNKVQIGSPDKPLVNAPVDVKAPVQIGSPNHPLVDAPVTIKIGADGHALVESPLTINPPNWSVKTDPITGTATVQVGSKDGPLAQVGSPTGPLVTVAIDARGVGDAAEKMLSEFKSSRQSMEAAFADVKLGLEIVIGVCVLCWIVREVYHFYDKRKIREEYK